MTVGNDLCSCAERLLLVGAVHHDPAGFEKTLALLETHRPDAVFIELSPFGYRFRRKNQRRLKKSFKRNLRKAAVNCRVPFNDARSHFQIRKILRQIALPFEYQAAVRYARACGSRIVLVDSSRFSRRCISSWPELLDAANLECLLRLPQAEPDAAKAYELARRTILEPHGPAHAAVLPESREEAEQWAERELFMAERIKIAIERFDPAKPIYLGGWWHLTKGNEIPTLRDLLAVDASRCHLLADRFLPGASHPSETEPPKSR